MMHPSVWVLLVAAPLGAVISALHYSLRDYNVVRLQELVEEHGRSSLVEAILADVPGYVLTTGFLRSLLNVVITAASLFLFDFVRVAPGTTPHMALHVPGLLLGGVLACVLVYLMGIVLPMSLAEHAGERLIVWFAVPLRLLHVLATPIRFLSFVDLGVRRLAGAQHVTKEEQIHEEIISAAAEGEREGQLDEGARRMIESIVGFGERTVEEIMTPRTEMEAIELTDDLAFIQAFIQQRGHSRIPVYQGDLDHIAGILYAKDLIKYLGTDPKSFRLKPILRRPVWVPEDKSLTELLYELRARKVHLAIVLDEFGGTAGLVTFEDLLEEIVGDIQDEYEPLSETLPEIEVNSRERTAEIDARARIVDVNEALEPLLVQIPEGEDYDTVAGFVLTSMGHIPVAGESFETEAVRVMVLEAEPTRVTKVRIEAHAPDEASPAEPDSSAGAAADGESAVRAEIRQA